ncbi:murein biosynthesis integral membrane protein MurJ [Bacillus spongiae]|uniref:Probable lipid II flippase MurJ n=1 Tax=Bacillus spongiae TaxID=2683610 RepID=A0ABU8HE12_9BACI
MMKFSKVFKAVGLVTLISALGKLLGFGREAIIAAYFGASNIADVFFVAFLIPTILFTATGSAIQAGIIPIYIEEKEKNATHADYFMSLLGTFFLLISIMMIILVLIFTKPIVYLMAPGFTEEQLTLAIQLTRIMVPSMFFLTLTAIATGVLNANKKFLLPAFTATAQNVVIIISTIILAKEYGVIGLSIGVLIGSVSQFFIQYPAFSKYNITFNFQFKKEKEKILKTLTMFYPIIIASVAVQLNSVVDRMISSSLDQGSVSALNYAYRLLWLPLSITLAPLITVLYPSIVEFALESKNRFLHLMTKGMNTIIFLSIPFIVVMIVDGVKIIEIVFQRGAFSTEDTLKTNSAFYYYAIGLAFFALRDFLMNCFYALKKTKVAMYSCLIAVVFNIILSYLLSKSLHVSGIALASSLSMFIQCFILFFYLKRDLEWGIPSKKIIKSTFQIMTTFSLSYVAGKGAMVLILDFHPILELFLVSLVIFSTYFISCILLKIEHINPLIKKRTKEPIS